MSIYSMLFHYYHPQKPELEGLAEAQQKAAEFVSKMISENSVRRRNLAGKNVIVVGAGFAGLSAALWLKYLGVQNITVLEARNRVGGRVHSLIDFSPARIIEGGAELIGLNQPLWLELARSFGLGLSVFTSEEYFAGAGLESPLYLKGSLLTEEQKRLVFEEMTIVIEQITLEAVPIHALQPWDSPDAEVLDRLSLADRLAQFQISDLTREAFAVMMSNDNAVPIENQSYLAVLAAVKGGGLMDYWTESEVFRCETGNQSLAESMAHYLKECGGCQLLLNHPVTDIRILDGEVRVAACGRSFTADYMVLAVPQTIWPQIRITPQLPPELKPTQGPAVKYLSNIKNRFWIRQGLAPVALSDQLGETWEGTDNQMFIKGQGLELSVFAGGPYAAAALAAKDLQLYFTSRIETLYPGYKEEALNRKFMAWPQKPWTQTGYSCPSPGQVTTLGPILASPYHGRLFFAGEYASPDFFGYMEGALETGLFAALRILEQEGLLS